MAIIKSYRGKTPRVDSNVFLAENATLIGDISIGNHSSIWFGAVLRGDVGGIKIGNGTNIQDGAIIHSTEDLSSVSIGDGVTVGHLAIVHGAIIGDRVLVGMHSTVLDNAVVENEVIIAAGSVVLANSILESGWLYAGIPAKKIKQLSEELLAGIREGADHYVKMGRRYKEEVNPVV